MLELYEVKELGECALVVNNVVIATADPDIPEECTPSQLKTIGRKLAEALSEPLVMRNISSEGWPDTWEWDGVIALLGTVATVTKMIAAREYTLTEPYNGYKAGTHVYDQVYCDYGIANDDTRATGVEHRSVTLDNDGNHTGFTVPAHLLKPC
ncbi:hypothetical protein HAP94_04455 [Acidithiobacillus ferrivorans]|nr:hypothetical protein [Acidithiobacillus ferrivorans]